ncbi:MAG: FtsW/RodA/SpoVE family cell cycle protein, partial [Pyrinomonadaceae bacterium]|nr:FtsW/RodA/SpoVE family cell cycle protein [Pyrinomonadaceae bacterium]
GVASGGTTGRGLGLGFVELIPVADSDYIYAAIAEELGLLGGLLIIFALLIFVSAGVRTALDCRDMFSKLCCIGLTAFIGFQALVNIGGITRALPMTGITLPFVSHGGFSLITSFIMLGMLMAFSHRNSVDRQINLNQYSTGRR